MQTGTRVLFRYSGALGEALRLGTPAIAAYDRHTAVVVRPLTAEEADADAGSMFRIRFDDGHEGDAFVDELEPIR